MGCLRDLWYFADMSETYFGLIVNVGVFLTEKEYLSNNVGVLQTHWTYWKVTNQELMIGMALNKPVEPVHNQAFWPCSIHAFHQGPFIIPNISALEGSNLHNKQWSKHPRLITLDRWKPIQSYLLVGEFLNSIGTLSFWRMIFWGFSNVFRQTHIILWVVIHPRLESPLYNTIFP